MTTKQIDKHLTASGGYRKRTVMTLNFLGGLAWGLGSVIGASLVVAFIAWILQIFGAFEGLKYLFPQTFK